MSSVNITSDGDNGTNHSNVIEITKGVVLRVQAHPQRSTLDDDGHAADVDQAVCSRDEFLSILIARGKENDVLYVLFSQQTG